MKTLNSSDLVIGATYAIDYDGSEGGTAWKGQAIFRGIDIFAEYKPNALCFECLDPVTGKPDGYQGVFNIRHVKKLGQHQGSLTDQLIELHRIAVGLNLYDAADYLKAKINP